MKLYRCAEVCFDVFLPRLFDGIWGIRDILVCVQFWWLAVFVMVERNVVN